MFKNNKKVTENQVREAFYKLPKDKQKFFIEKAKEEGKDFIQDIIPSSTETLNNILEFSNASGMCPIDVFSIMKLLQNVSTKRN